ncbi:hypothetical protein [Mycobacterium dioxanotrophicus]|uniref:hypothetical protein n=1 Tax=Mycobacterium dioxanotrophicus TaxID=482462 RepID=UPI0012FC88AA|nr:hypothetical protein [Mycobacterium dioxanotrophicus]
MGLLLDLLDVDWRLAGEKPYWVTRDELSPTFYLPSRDTWLRAETDDDDAAYCAFEDLEELEFGDYPDGPPEGGWNLDDVAPCGEDESRPRHDDILLVAVSGIPDPAKFEGASTSATTVRCSCPPTKAWMRRICGPDAQSAGTSMRSTVGVLSD